MTFSELIKGILKFKIRNFFGLVLAIILLGFYVITWSLVIVNIINAPDTVEDIKATYLTEGFFYIATASAGIASALAIAILGATPPDKSPKFEYLNSSTGGSADTDTLTILYLLAWVIIGVSAVIFGVINPVPEIHKNSLIGTAHQNLKVYGNTWFGMALSAVFVYFKLRPTLDSETKKRTDVESKLKVKIDEGKIIFDGPSDVSARLKSELFRENDGQKITSDLQKLILHLSEIVGTKIRVSSLVRNHMNFNTALQKHFSLFAGHPGGEAVDIGNEEVAEEILSLIANDSEVSRLKIDEIIFDAKVSGNSDRNFWNYDKGAKHNYNTDTLDNHKDHIHFKVF